MQRTSAPGALARSTPSWLQFREYGARARVMSTSSWFILIFGLICAASALTNAVGVWAFGWTSFETQPLSTLLVLSALASAGTRFAVSRRR